MLNAEQQVVAMVVNERIAFAVKGDKRLTRRVLTVSSRLSSVELSTFRTSDSSRAGSRISGMTRLRDIVTGFLQAEV
jgi:hypothetical protein